MFADRKRMGLLYSVFMALIILSLLGCDFFEEPGGSLEVPLTSRRPAGTTTNRARTSSRTRSRQARAHWPAPRRRARVAGGKLPALAGLPGEFSLGEGVTYGAIRIFPIYCSASEGTSEEYMTLAEAQRRGHAEITERSDGATVGSIQIVNNSDRPIYVVSGDIIRGGRQDRVIAMDMIVPPHSTLPISARVFCVESGRWSPGASGNRFVCEEQACINLKKSLATASVSQGEVWAKVGRINAALGTTNSTGTYSRAFQSASASSKVDAYTRAFLKEFKKDKKAVGFAACVGNRVVGCDVFLNPSLLAAMREKIISSYIMGIMSMEASPGRAGAKAEDVAGFFRDAARADVSAQRRGETCSVYRVEHGMIEGFFTEVAGKRTHLFLTGR